MKNLLVAVIIAILFVPSMAPAYKQVRDGSGNLVETWTRQGVVSKSGTVIII